MMRNIISAFCLAATLVLSVHAAPESTWLQAGAAVPAVKVGTVEGEAVQLSAELNGRPTVLIFYRGGWCPYCTRHLAALAEAEPEILAAGYQLLAISPDQPAKLRTKPTHEKLHYTLLSDSSMAAAHAFGIAFKVPDELVAKYKESYGIDIEEDSGQLHHLLPHPAVFIIDAGGIIRFAHVDPDYKVRMTPAAIMAAIKMTDVPAK